MAEHEVASPQPRSLSELFWAFTGLALQGFGGVIAVAQRELCEHRRWLSTQEFVDLLAAAQVLPGPNVCNLSIMIGDRFFGWRGALTALAGMITAPLALMLLVAALLGEAQTMWPDSQGAIRGALIGIAAVAAGQIIGTVLRLAAPLRQHVLGPTASLGLAALAFGLMVGLGWPLLWVLLGLGGAACLVCYAQLRRRAPSAAP
jgi:chromate transporter